MTTIETISLLASIASLILAVLAICLSIVFYRMSADATRATEDASKGISSSVERLESIFEKLYSDTFSVMRETVTDMRKHILTAPTVKNQIQLARDVERDPKNEDAKFTLIDSMSGDVEIQIVILASETEKDIPKHLKYVYEFDDLRAGNGQFGMMTNEARLEGTGIFDLAGGAGNYLRITDEGKRFAQWLIKKGRKASFFWTPIGSWGSPKEGGFAEKSIPKTK